MLIVCAMNPPLVIRNKEKYLAPIGILFMLNSKAYPTIVIRPPVMSTSYRRLIRSDTMAALSVKTAATAKIGIVITCARIDVQPSCLKIVGVKNTVLYVVVVTPKKIKVLETLSVIYT